MSVPRLLPVVATVEGPAFDAQLPVKAPEAHGAPSPAASAGQRQAKDSQVHVAHEAQLERAQPKPVQGPLADQPPLPSP
eukprot:3107639-Pyramimonas_sp.AAC.1